VSTRIPGKKNAYNMTKKETLNVKHRKKGYALSIYYYTRSSHVEQKERKERLVRCLSETKKRWGKPTITTTSCM